MRSLNPIIANRILFDRIDDPSVKNYVVQVSESTENGMVDYKLSTIPNPKGVNAIKNKEVFAPSEDRKYKLKRESVLYDNTYPLAVFINGKRLNNILVFYSSKDQLVTVDYSELESWDTVEIEYYFDGVEFIHETDKMCYYRIDLDIDYSLNTVGNHNVLI